MLRILPNRESGRFLSNFLVDYPQSLLPELLASGPEEVVEVHMGAKCFTIAHVIASKHCTEEDSLCNQDPEITRALTHREYIISPPGAVNSGQVTWEFPPPIC